MELESQMIQGTVAAVVYQNPENGYCVLKVRTDQPEPITVVGTIPMSVAGERLAIVGKWTQHPSFGQQFEAEFLERLMPETTSEILAFLSSRAVKGIGPRTAQKIVDRFGAQSLDILERDPRQLTAIGGISEKKALEMSESFQRQSGIRRLIEFLTMYHLPAQLAVRLYRVYGELAQEALRDDPYLLTDAYYRADFSLVDAFAIALGISADDERRVEAGVLFELSFNLGAGHTFIPQDKLCAASCALLELDAETIEAGMLRLQEQGRMELCELAGLRACYLPELYEAEQSVCQTILRMAQDTCPAPPRLAELLEQISENAHIDYAPEQLRAIRGAAESRLLLVTGGPGTGKTTVMSGIMQLFDAMKLKTQLAAPTGRAAKRLAEVTGREASTIHRLLEARFDEQSGAMAFFHDEDDPLGCDALIVDETSMVDLPLMASLLKALKPGCRLILVGDPDQLPPVGPGNVFSDLIRSGVVQTVRLTQIFRQAQKSLIVMNSHAVNQGQLPVLTETKQDFFFLRRHDPAAAVRTIQELCLTRLPQNMGIQPSEIQVLSPSRKQQTGTKSLNQALQAVLNPPMEGKKEKKYGDFSFRIGDRVMQIRNNYDIMWKREDGLGAGTGIFNGDIGSISQIDFQQQTMTIQFEDKLAEYSFDMLGELELAYAMTVHKSQGSEYRAVILPLLDCPRGLMTRNMLYTAVTRAQSLVILVGKQSVMGDMIENNVRQNKYTGLSNMLKPVYIYPDKTAQEGLTEQHEQPAGT